MNEFTNILDYQNDLLWVKEIRSVGSVEQVEGATKIISSNGNDCCFVDEIDADLTRLSWTTCNGYFVRHASRRHPKYPSRRLFLHRFILERVLGRPMVEGEFVDHIDLDRRNNRRSNLRLASKAENAYNIKQHRDSSNIYKGVSSSGSKFRCQIRYSVMISEVFDTQEDAARFYDEMAAKHHGRFARFNFPDEWKFDESTKQWENIRTA